MQKNPLLIIIFLISFTTGIACNAPAAGITYHYDDLNRLIRAVYADGSSASYVYDDAGNREQKTVNAVILPGDSDANGGVDLRDVILDLMIVSGMKPLADAAAVADVNGNGKIGMEEAVYGLQSVAGLQ